MEKGNSFPVHGRNKASFFILWAGLFQVAGSYHEEVLYFSREDAGKYWRASLFLLGLIVHQSFQCRMNGFRHKSLTFRIGMQWTGFFPVNDNDRRVTE